jgi:hypothetical protein
MYLILSFKYGLIFSSKYDSCSDGILPAMINFRLVLIATSIAKWVPFMYSILPKKTKGASFSTYSLN